MNENRIPLWLKVIAISGLVFGALSLFFVSLGSPDVRLFALFGSAICVIAAVVTAVIMRKY